MERGNNRKINKVKILYTKQYNISKNNVLLRSKSQKNFKAAEKQSLTIENGENISVDKKNTLSIDEYRNLVKLVETINVEFLHIFATRKFKIIKVIINKSKKRGCNGIWRC